MTVFAVIASTGPEAMRTSVKAQYGANFYEFSSNVWFVADGGTCRTVSDKLGLTSGANGSQGVVIEARSFYGYALPAAWTWLQQYPEARADG